MRSLVRVSLALGMVGASSGLLACSSSSSPGFQTGGNDSGVLFQFDAGGGTDTGTVFVPPGSDSGSLTPTGDGSVPTGDTGTTTTTTATTIYAHTDTTLYSMDPSTHAVTELGTFSGMVGGSTETITDLAVDSAGDVYVNSETEVYKATLPSSPGAGAKVSLAKFAAFSGSKSGAKLYALAFAPAGAIGVSTLSTGETLVGGDGNGDVWVIQSDGTATDVGNFGRDPNDTSKFLGLSGDMVFYTNSAGQPTGLATIRSCSKSSSGKSGSSSVTCTKTDDYLAGVDMANLKANASGGGSASLLGGIYGGTTSTDGNGTGHAEIFGLGAWGNDVYGFSRSYNGGSPALLLIDTSSGSASVVDSSFSFTNGWSGAGVTTQVTITVTAPPSTQPK